ncbi:MAG: hypothetical protein K2W97_02505 [Chthoniobacterales bacterium]|nr:hypothetical protein [Chthoniobacterales bacterium]
MKKTFASPQNLIHFSLLAFVVSVTTFFFPGHLSAQNWGNVYGGSGCTTADSAKNWDPNSFNGSNDFSGEVTLSGGSLTSSNNYALGSGCTVLNSMQNGDQNNLNLLHPTATISISGDLLINAPLAPLQPGFIYDGSLNQNGSLHLSTGSSSFVVTGSPSDLIGPSNLLESVPPLTGSNSYFPRGINVGSKAIIDFASQTIKTAEIKLADGSKIINGRINLDKAIFSSDGPLFSLESPLFLEDIATVLNGMSISQDENQVYDLNGGVVILPMLNFKNGGKITNGTINITSDHPNYVGINEMIFNNPIKIPALSSTTAPELPVLSGKIPEGAISIHAKDLNGLATFSDEMLSNHLQ